MHPESDPPSAAHKAKPAPEETALGTSTANKRSNEYTGYRFYLFYKYLYTGKRDRSWELFPPHPTIRKIFL